ncbi:MAG: alanine racemase [Alphaproteobacteria bacterium]|jgi:D-serine deaminase-like pyridoxal phosphate-dependent protein|nr:alanine racemase [Alphaproteobacteria bacterium]
MTKLADLATPALVIERGRLVANLERMKARARALGVRLRPHMKIAKTAEIAELAVEEKGRGIAVQTLAEAEFFAQAGYSDITICAGMIPSKLDRAARLADAGVTVITDSPDVAQAIAAHGDRFEVLVEIDCGGHRAGIFPESTEVIEIAKILDGAPRATFAGVLTNAAHCYQGRTRAEFEAIAEQERGAVVDAAERISGAGISCPVVSVGSTATAVTAKHLDGATETRPGLYVFNDLFRAGVGLCAPDDIALSLLSRVIGHYRSDNRLLIDAGVTSLSLDRGTERIEGGDQGFGVVLDEDLRPIAPGLKVARLHTEHAWVAADEPLPFDSLPIGTMVRILPNHANNTATMHRHYDVVDGTSDVIARWSRQGGW